MLIDVDDELWLKVCESKEEEKQMNVFMLTKFINIEYSEDKTIKDLYALLKETEPFKGAIDV